MSRYLRLTQLSERISCLGRPNRPFPLSFEVAAARFLGWVDSGKARTELGYLNRSFVNTCRATLAWLKAVGVIR